MPGDGTAVELVQILKDDAVKVLHSIGQQIWKTQQWPQDWKRSVFIPIPKKDKAKECSNQELPDVQAGFRKDKQKTAYEMVVCDWSSDVCSSDLALNRPANLENSAVATGLEKVSFHSNPKERQYQRMFKLPNIWYCLVPNVFYQMFFNVYYQTSLAIPKNVQTIALFSHTSKVMIRILQARLEQYRN